MLSYITCLEYLPCSSWFVLLRCITCCNRVGGLERWLCFYNVYCEETGNRKRTETGSQQIAAPYRIRVPSWALIWKHIIRPSESSRQINLETYFLSSYSHFGYVFAVSTQAIHLWQMKLNCKFTLVIGTFGALSIYECSPPQHQFNSLKNS